MTNNITSRFGNDLETEYKEMQRLPNEILIEEAQYFKYANLPVRLGKLFLPGLYSQNKDIARTILKERGIDYKIKEQEYNLRKEKTKQEWRALGNFIKEINPFRILYNLLNKNPLYK